MLWTNLTERSEPREEPGKRWRGCISVSVSLQPFLSLIWQKAQMTYSQEERLEVVAGEKNALLKAVKQRDFFLHHLTASEAPFLNSRIRDSSMKTENAKCSSGTWKSFSNSLLSCVHNEGPQGETVAIRREAAHLLQPPLSVKLKRSERSESLGEVASFAGTKILSYNKNRRVLLLFCSFLFF